MTDSSRPADALLTEHFRYTPLSLIDEIINAVNIIVYRAIEAIENGLFSIPPETLGFRAEQATRIPDTDGNSNIESPEVKEEIENGVHQLETLLEATVDKTFDKFEIYTLRNILTVSENLAPWMRLGHYENLTLTLPPSAPTPESILGLRRKLQETRKLNLALRTVQAENAAILTALTSLLSPPRTSNSTDSKTPSTPCLTFLNTDKLARSASSNPLTVHSEFAVSNLPALRTLVDELRPKLENLRQGGVKVDWESRREDRRVYIEGRVRKIIGEGAEGEEVGGTRVGLEEAVGLENVVESLRRGRNADGDG
ncbi:hypothetical protein MMC31_000104 [Peltigera leucophlebia]|nr:hypothetical protein [Peltigera leucophlebia]